MLTIYWTTEQTTQLPEGGDGVSQTFEELRLDIVDGDSYEGATTYTEHSVEQGVPVTDNAEPQLERYSVTAWVSERPARMDLVEGTMRVTPDGVDASFITPPEGTTRAVDTLTQLNELRRNATLVSVEGARQPIEDWVLESVGAPRTTSDAGALVVNLVFREWRTVSLEDVDAPSPTVERGRRQANQGQQTATEEDDETPSADPENRASVAEQLRQALGGTTGQSVRGWLTGGTS